MFFVNPPLTIFEFHFKDKEVPLYIMRSLRKYVTESKTISEESVSFDEFCVNDMVFRHSKKCAKVDMLIKPSLRKYSIVIAFECNVAFLINNDMIFEVSPSDICIIDDVEQDATSIEDFEALIWFLTSEFERIHTHNEEYPQVYSFIR